MKAVILAAGKGTRMRDLTNEVPKPMLKVEGKPILQHIIEGLVSAGINRICLITGYRAESIEAYFQDGAKWNSTISYVRQTVQDGTGKAPELARSFVAGDPFLLSYGDILVLPDTYKKMLARFFNGDFAGLITVTPGQDVSKGGINFFDEQFTLRKVVEKPTPGQIADFQRMGWMKSGSPVWYNAGIYIFQSSLFDFTANLSKSIRGEYELPDAVNTMVEASHRIAGLEIAGRWVDVRDPEVLAALQTTAEP